MKITAIQLTNFRQFASFEIALDEKVTLLVGSNASGKTTILDAMAIAVGPWLAWSKNTPRPIKPTDARHSGQMIEGMPTLSSHFPVSVSAQGKSDGQSISWSRELLQLNDETTTEKAKSLRRAAIISESLSILDSSAALPLFAYYGTGRFWFDTLESKPFKMGARVRGYENCLSLNADIRLVEEWMEWQEQARIQRIARAFDTKEDPHSVKTPHLAAVQAAACSCLEGATRFFYDLTHRELRVEFKNGVVSPLSHLSDGQRSLIALASDLAWRAVQLNPQLGVNAPKETSGVVIIDEIEMHLHPAWQRRVITDLIQTFPTLQFIITTHSPQVISTARPEWLRIMSPNGAYTMNHIHGRDTNALLSEVMGVAARPDEMEAKFAKLERLIEDDHLKPAAELLEEIRQDVGDSDRSLMALEWELQDQESTHAND